MKKIRFEADLEDSLCKYPELIDLELRGIRQGMEFVNPLGPYLKRQDRLPSNRLADMVFVEPCRITVVELKKVPLKVSYDEREDPIDQISDYLEQCRLKYPGRALYRGFLVGSQAQDENALGSKILATGQKISILVFGRHIPTSIVVCDRCGLARGFDIPVCVCVKT